MSENDLVISLLQENEHEALITLLTSELWNFHGTKFCPEQRTRKLLQEGYFLSAEAETFLLRKNGEVCGMLRIFDLDDEIPMFDIRLSASFRGKNIGKAVMAWLKNYIFCEKGYRKLEGNTRVDNLAMRKLFLQANFIKEGHGRKSWPDDDGNYYDSIAYGILREDYLENKITPVNWNDEIF